MQRYSNTLKQAELGICPSCQKPHPENVHHEGYKNFWTSFCCPECGYKLKVHINDKQDSLSRRSNYFQIAYGSMGNGWATQTILAFSKRWLLLFCYSIVERRQQNKASRNTQRQNCYVFMQTKKH